MSDYTVNVAASQNGFSADAIAASSEDETESVDHVHKRLVLFSQKTRCKCLLPFYRFEKP